MSLIFPSSVHCFTYLEGEILNIESRLLIGRAGVWHNHSSILRRQKPLHDQVCEQKMTQMVDRESQLHPIFIDPVSGNGHHTRCLNDGIHTRRHSKTFAAAARTEDIETRSISRAFMVVDGLISISEMT